MATEIHLVLNSDQALILFEFLARHDGKPVGDADRAEEAVLWAIEGQLETQLVEPFAPNYGELLERARKRILGAE